MAFRERIQNVITQLKQTGIILGGILIALLFYSTMSGIILSFFYDPAPGKAYESMQSIVGIPLLAFIRNFHYWSSDLLLFVLFLHVTRVALTKPVGSALR